MSTQETAALYLKVVVSSDGLLPTAEEMPAFVTLNDDGLELLACEASGDWDAEEMDTSKWGDNHVQFARLIAELEAAGAITYDVTHAVCESMDLKVGEVMYLLDRAQSTWDKAKALDTPKLKRLLSEPTVFDQAENAKEMT